MNLKQKTQKNTELKRNKVTLKKLKKEVKGITLIALVVTIIVLLILAGVAISLTIGNNGIFTRAGDAVNKYEKASKNEEDEMKKAEEIIDEYLNEKKAEIPEGLEIGSEVTYSPSGTYTWDSAYCSSSEDESLEMTLESGEGKKFHIEKWKVFDINEKTGEITLMPEHPTASLEAETQEEFGVVGLQGAQGYNNAVYLLNEACSYLYGNEEKGIKARSINIGDIEGKMTKEALEEAHSYEDSYEALVAYGKQVTSGYGADGSYYPIIYGKETLRSIDGGERIEEGLGMSEQTEPIEPTDEGAEEGYLQGTNLRPTQTFWRGDVNFMKTAFETEENGVNYYNLLMPDGENTFYWVASRGVGAYDGGHCLFEVIVVDGGGMKDEKMFYSLGYDDRVGNIDPLFPVVSLSSELIEGNEAEGFVVK